MNYLILFWIVSGFLAANYIYYKIKFNVRNPDFPNNSFLVYGWLIFLGLTLGVFLFYRAQDDEWIHDLIDDLENI